MSDNVSLTTPWVEYYRKLEALFAKDDEVVIIYNNDTPEVKILVDNSEKADALTKLLPMVKEFGNVKLMITVIPANEPEFSKLDLFQKVFEGNGAFHYTTVVEGPISNTINFVVFEKEVVQYFNDDMGDIHGLRSTLYEDIAREIFDEHEGIYFCTDNE